MRRLGSLLVLFLAAAVHAQPNPNAPAEPKNARRDLTNSPPVAVRAAVRLLKEPRKEGNAVLLVEFGPGERAPRTLTLTLEREKATLRDDGVAPDERAGDGVHSAWVHVDQKELEAAQKRQASNKELPLFAGRELVGTVTVVRSDAKQSFKELPAVPNRATLADRRQGEKLSLRVSVAAALRPDLIIPIFPFTDPASIDPARSLMITNPGVVNDPTRTFNPCTGVGTPMGKWTFGHLMSEMANGSGLSGGWFTRRWLRKWEIDQTVNDFVVPHRANITNVINAWPKLPSGELDLARAPFKLVAIVNRIDLGGNLVYGGGGAGEARFIFALTNNTCNPLPFLVIFEYKVNRTGCLSVKAWANQWKNLASFAVGSAAYNTALEAITVQFTEAGTNPSQTPNHSSLSQLRTNEIALAGPWELREFRLSSATGLLFEDTVKQTPDISFNHTADLANYANTPPNPILIVQDKHTVPDELIPPGIPFLGGAAPVPAPSFHWDGPLPEPSVSMSGTPNLRHHLSLNTCNGCHGGETSTVFTHVSQTGALSGFLTGISVLDPAGEGVTRNFNDLLRRQQRMAQILDQPCLFHIFFDPLRMIH